MKSCEKSQHYEKIDAGMVPERKDACKTYDGRSEADQVSVILWTVGYFGR